ncbi:SMI1/KNR4 family protein [Quadrisphaera oryzae]|uniref:SMI1/KNR4 family protein n=1 Tax=Quadrisphaera TaxID=317661 RepID=UPI001643FE6E|nr:SMI1/KNR4 family protein [Quadrisphaera sp. RL12-1S]MBC3762305.1 SMI1/KNR4 family protein [Quadrisphaera sp. RL12-1S]
MSDDAWRWCRDIDQHLETLGRLELIESLMPGVSQAESHRQFMQRNLVNTGQLEQLLSWHNGLSPNSSAKIGQICIMPGFYLLGLGEIIQAHLDFRDDTRWNPGWVPFMTDGGGDFMFIDTTQAAPPRVHRYRSVELEHPAEYLSIEGMLQTISKAYETGVFFPIVGGIEMDDDEYARLAAGINPGIEWWLT